MKKVFLVGILLMMQLIVFGQSADEKIIYIVDSVVVKDDPKEGNEILQDDILDFTVIKDRDKLKLLGYENFDGVIYLFTKEYRKRSDSLKRIPSSNQMERKDGVYLFRGQPYNGPIIDYYYSGRKQGEGIFLNGKINGYRVMYFQNGKTSAERTYQMGIVNGLAKEYYEDGSLKQKGEFVNGKEEGVWESYFPNGQVKLRSKYIKGEVNGDATKYYSTGRIKESVFINKGKVIPDPQAEKLTQLMNKSYESTKEGDVKGAIKYCNKAIELDSAYAEAYFSRGTIKLNNFEFDDAIMDFDKALQLEPFMEVALGNRAFARIRKQQFGNSRTLSKTSEVTILASKDGQ
jgi:tetratricopeptide (TPR) repeat protein